MNQQEQQLRILIREGIHIVQKRRKKQARLEEKRLRKAIRHLIPEVSRKTAVADKVIHKNTGINVLDALLKRIIVQIEDPYTNLSSSSKERESFRYHFLTNFLNLLSPIDANRNAPTPQLNEADFEVEIEQDDVINSAADAEKFLPSRPQDIEAAQEDAEEEKRTFVKLDSEDPYVKQGADASEIALNQVQQQIVTAYEGLIAPEDAATFKEWGLTNLKLYFDKFEGEMTNTIEEEPPSPDYPPSKTETEEDAALISEISYNI
jgi:hypothetical protein